MRISDWSSDVCSSDLLDTADREERLGEAAKRDDVVAISALTGEGVEALLETIGALLTSGHRRYRIAIDTADGAGAAWLHQHGEVLDHTLEGDTRSEENTSELQSLMRICEAVFCLKKKKQLLKY